MKKTAEEKWLNRFKKLADSVPEGLEAVITSDDNVCLCEKGTTSKHSNGPSSGWGMDESQIIESATFDSIKLIINPEQQ